MSRPDEVDEGLIHAWLDGELTGEEAARVERLAATDAAWSAAVAEARGLIAASSRIVGALDAVSGGVVPAGSTAAPRRVHRVRPWMRMAAGFLLVAGTAYTVREAMTPTVTAEVDVAAPPIESPVAVAQPSPPPPAPTTSAAPPPRVEEAAEVEKAAETVAEPTADRRADEGAQLAITPQRARAERAPAAAPARSAAEPTRDFSGAGAASAGPLRALEDCWRVTAPDSLAALYRDLTVLRQSGDTLVLVLPNAMLVTVVRRGDTLSGALTALRVSCPLGSSTAPRDSK